MISDGTRWRVARPSWAPRRSRSLWRGRSYSITHRALDLGYTGLALFLPGLLFLLPAGHVADRFDRRQVILVCYSLQVFATLTLLEFARAGMHQVLPIYAVAIRHRHGARFLGAGERGAVPHLVPESTS